MKQVRNGKYTDFFNGNVRVGYLDPHGDLYAIWCGFAEKIGEPDHGDNPAQMLGEWLTAKK